jgi:alkylation response protein AidB-like acyl-CoA dehydrogenase
MEIEIEASRLLVQRAAWMADHRRGEMVSRRQNLDLRIVRFNQEGGRIPLLRAQSMAKV